MISEKHLWAPTDDQVENSNMTRFAGDAGDRWGRNLGTYRSLHNWSVTEPDEFWRSIWDWTNVIGSGSTDPVVQNSDRVPGARWFPNVTLNFAENLLRRRDRAPALIFRSED